jgi:Zn-dependent protease with chaperone function
MIYLLLVGMAALISAMFVATAVSSFVNFLRENEADRRTLRSSQIA